MAIRIHNWAVVSDADPYKAPEQIRSHLNGTVEGHHRIPDGESVTTSAIEKTEGRLVTTSSGSIYVLGEPAKEYLKWLSDNGMQMDEENPVKVHGPAVYH